jgi:hypothetical protein
MGPIGFNFPTWFFRVLIAILGAAACYHKFANYCSIKWLVSCSRTLTSPASDTYLIVKSRTQTAVAVPVWRKELYLTMVV